MHWFVRNFIGSARQTDGSAFYRINEPSDKENVTELSTIVTLNSKIGSEYQSPFPIEPKLDSPPPLSGVPTGGSGSKSNKSTEGGWKRVAKGFISNL